MNKVLKSIFAVGLSYIIVLCSALVGIEGIADLFSLTAVASNLTSDNSIQTYMASVILNHDYDGIAKIGDTTIPNMRYSRFTNLELATLAKPIVEEINSNVAFRISEAAWEVGTFSLSDILSKEDEQIEYYETILLSIVNSYIEFNIIPSVVVNYSKNITDIAKSVAEATKQPLEKIYNEGILIENSAELSAANANDIYSAFVDKYYSDWSKAYTVSSDISKCIKAYSKTKEFCQELASYLSCIELSDDVVLVLDELYKNCPSTNMELKIAIQKIKIASESAFGGFLLEGANVLEDIFEETVLKEMWKGVLDATIGELGLAVRVGQMIGRAVCNIMFSTDKIIEQWYKMNALVTIEESLVKSIFSLANRYKNSMTNENARVFISALQMLSEVYTQDYEMSEDLEEYVKEKGLWNNLKKWTLKVFGKYDGTELDEFHSNINCLKSGVNDLTVILSPGYYENFYANDMGISSTQSEKIDYLTGKIVTIQCPTDIDVYNSEGQLVLQTRNNEITVSSFDDYVIIQGDEKWLSLTSNDDYRIEISAFDDGCMNYEIFEIIDSELKRQLEYIDVPISTNDTFSSVVTSSVYQESKLYNLIKNGEEIIECNYDSLPLLEADVVDVIVAEELFEGFSIELIDLVANAMFNLESSVDVSAYQISTDNIVALFSAVQKYYPSEYTALTISDFSYKAIVSPSLNIVTRLRFYYGDDVNLSVMQKRAKDLQTEVDNIVVLMQGMDEFEKALFVHDYLVLHAEYDLELLEIIEKGNLPNEVRNERYTEYSILVNGTGVCGSYALAYRAVLNAAGMECLFLSSIEMNHAWNLVKIDGKWYHVDCCWDDPVLDTYGQARRNYFLRTDEEIMKLSHYSWSPTNYKSTDLSFVNMPRMNDIRQKYDYATDYWYSVDGSQIVKQDKYGNNLEIVGNMSVKSLSVSNGEIYYSTGKRIYKYDEENLCSTLLYMIPKSKCGTDVTSAGISNLYVFGDVANYYLDIKTDTNQRKTVLQTVSLNSQQFVSIAELQLNEQEMSLELFQNYNLECNAIDSNNEIINYDFEFEWTSSNNNIVTVEEGYIKARNTGTATVTVSLDEYCASCQISVLGNGLEGSCSENITWHFNQNTNTLLLTGSGKMLGFSRNSIPWYHLKDEIEKVEIQNGVVNIGRLAFSGCEHLKTVLLPNSITAIDSNAFSDCTQLEEITLPENLTSIGPYAFHNADIHNIYIPKNVEEIGAYAFGWNRELSSITVSEENETYYDIDGVLVKKSNHELIYYPSGRETQTYIVPEEIKKIGRNTIDRYAKIKHIIIPNTVENSIDTYAFSHLDYLISIDVDQNNTKMSSIDGVLFNKAGTTLICYPAGNTDEVYFVPDCVSIIDNSAFDGSKFETVVFNRGVNKIGNGFHSTEMFMDSEIKEMYILNPTCTIDLDYYGFLYPDDLTIYGIASSSAETWAQKRNLNFVAIDVENHEHKYYLINTTSSILGTDGFLEYSCWCGHKETKTVHYFNDAEIIAPTCIEEGYTVKSCLNCSYTEYTDMVPCTGRHTYEIIDIIPATCTTDGYENYKCSVCEESFTKTISADDGHQMEETVIHSTCTKRGYTQAVCSLCGETMLYNYTNPIGHKLQITSNSGHCTAHGTLTYACKRCDYSEEVANNTNSIATEILIENPTCTKAGVRQEICVLCKAIVSTDSITALGHTYSDEYTVDKKATCLANGYKSRHCTVCGAKGYEEVISAPGKHIANEGIVTTQATCKDVGVKTFNCTQCGEFIRDESIPKSTQHSFVTTVQKLTCTQEGYTLYTCSVCGYNYKDDTNPASGHNYQNGICTRCNQKCNHMCHQYGLMGFLWKVVAFLGRLFGIASLKNCACGKAHW